MTHDEDELEHTSPERGHGSEACAPDGTEGSGPEFERTVSISGLAEPLMTASGVGGTIGGYHVIGLLGEGGMGVVYEAEQQSPHRRVALKVMRRGHLVDEVHTRMFHHEAQTLARLRHPRIAAIFESGHTADGHDFFAMELVRGRTLDSWLEANPVGASGDGLPGRLRLFRSICDPVQYAHQRGVIHRDLKPANIMVADDEGDSGSISEGVPTVKVLDFGLARITDPDMQAVTMMSEAGAIRGTLPYMSPEQTRSAVEAVDVRTDVYALGVILYEMLADRRPYDLDGAPLVDALRIICEEPPRPLERTAGARLDHDLETIVDTALAKDPDRRYASVAALAEDVDRYLSARPILARRPSASYRVRKFVQRHRVSVAAGVVVLIAVVAGVVGVVSGLVRARNAEEQARREAATSARVSHFMADMLASVDAQQVGRLLLADLEQRVADSAAAQGLDPEPAVADFRRAMRSISGTDAGRRLVDDAILSRAGAAVRERFVDEPQVAGRLEHTLAETYERLGIYESALEHARRAADIRRSAFGGSNRETLQSEALIGLLSYREGRFEDAERALVDIRNRQQMVAGADHPDTLWSSARLAWVLIEQGRQAESEALLRAVLEDQRRVLGAEHRETMTTMNSLAVVFTNQQRFADAEALHAEALAIRNRVLGPTDPDTLKSLTNLAVVSYYQGRIDDAADLFSEVLDIQTETLGPDHPVTLGSMNNLAVIYERQGRLAEAETLHRRALETRREVLDAEHPEILSSQYNLAIVRTAQNRLDDALHLHREVLEARRRSLGERHPETLDSRCALAGVAALQGEREAALRLLNEAVELGYSNGDSLAGDSDFLSLRDDPEFAEIVERALRNRRAEGP